MSKRSPSIPLDVRTRIDRLDDAFLFVLGFSAIGFSAAESIQGGIKGSFSGIPLVLVTSVLPFYVGYVRGAIIHDSFVERVRGWVILVVGFSTLSGLLLTELTWFQEIYYYSGDLLPVSVFLLGVMLARWLAGRLFRVFQVEASSTDRAILLGGVPVAWIAPFLFTLIPEIISLQAPFVASFEGIGLYVGLMLPLVVFCFGLVVLERTCEALHDIPLAQPISDIPGHRWLSAFVQFFGAALSGLRFRQVSITLVAAIVIWGVHLPFDFSGFPFWPWTLSWSASSVLLLISLLSYVRIPKAVLFRHVCN